MQIFKSPENIFLVDFLDFLNFFFDLFFFVHSMILLFSSFALRSLFYFSFFFFFVCLFVRGFGCAVPIFY